MYTPGDGLCNCTFNDDTEVADEDLMELIDYYVGIYNEKKYINVICKHTNGKSLFGLDDGCFGLVLDLTTKTMKFLSAATFCICAQ